MLVTLAIAAATAALSEAEASATPLGVAEFTVQTTHGWQPSTTTYEAEPYEFDQAGGHPFALTSTVRFTTEELSGGDGPTPTEDPRDLIIDLPPGLLANPRAMPRCETSEGHACPSDSQVGVFLMRAHFDGHDISIVGPLVNLTPAPGEAALFGLETPLGRYSLRGRLVRGQSGYTLSVTADSLPVVGLTEVQTTLWGVPAAAAHDVERGVTCLRLDVEASSPWSCTSEGARSSGVEEVPLLTLPGQCTGTPLQLTAWTDSWEQTGRYASSVTTLPALEGCERLPFEAEVSLRSDTWLAEAPIGLDVELGVRQFETPAGIGSTQLRGALVRLPVGVTIDPSVGAGARACQASGPEGIDIPTGLDARGQPLRPGVLGEGEVLGPGGEARLAPGGCPPASTIGTAEAISPLLAQPLQGRVYLGAPGCGGPGLSACTQADAGDGNLFHVYVELGGRGSTHDEGVVLKLEGRLHVDPADGRLALQILDAPQLPLSRLQIKLFGGSGALLDNPSSCSPASAQAELQSWSAPDLPDLVLSQSYRAEGCPSPSPFAPTLLAGSQDVLAGGFTPFTVAVARGEREQAVSQLALRAPAGVSAMLASVPRCSPVAAASGDCPGATRIGSSSVSVGDGSQPLRLPGAVYLTGPYEGAPFGLVIVTSAVAGPLDLGRIVIRARLEVDPRTAALTIVSDPLPQSVLGVPLHLRELTLAIDRPGFIFNPTRCSAQQVQAWIASTQGAIAAPTNHFGLADCSTLAYSPRLSAQTSARAGIRDGASLTVGLTQPAGPGSGQANSERLRIALPRLLSTRLTSLQSSCPASTFATDPASCPPASVIGLARASTPMLPGEMLGPVYMVAHGRRNLPAPTVVLEGQQGLRLELDGTSALERGGRTAISFAGLPDLPLRSFRLELPRGPHSALAAAGDPCASARIVHGKVIASLPLSIELGGYNGRVLHRASKIAVVGCPRPRRRPSRHKISKRNAA